MAWTEWKSPQPERHGRYDVHEASQQTPSSLAGSPIWVLDSTNSFNVFSLGKFSFNTSYLVLNCSEPNLVNASAFPSGTLPMLLMSLNMMNNNVNGGSNNNNNNNTPRSLDVWGRFGHDAVHVTCSITTAYVEVQVRCDAPGCVAQKMRPTPGSPSPNRTLFDDDDFASTFSTSSYFRLEHLQALTTPHWSCNPVVYHGPSLIQSRREESLIEPRREDSLARATTATMMLDASYRLRSTPTTKSRRIHS
jgi:hypothetical protein